MNFEDNGVNVRKLAVKQDIRPLCSLEVWCSINWKGHGRVGGSSRMLKFVLKQCHVLGSFRENLMSCFEKLETVGKLAGISDLMDMLSQTHFHFT